MKLDKLRAFAAGLGVQQKDPASGSRLSKSQLLEAVVAALRSRPDTEAWFRSFRRVVLPCRILVASDVRRLDVGMRERTIVSHTPLGFLELPLLACAVGFHRASFSARSRLRILWMLFLMLSIYGLKQQYMVKTGSMLSWMAR